MLIGITGPTGAGKDTAAEYLSSLLKIPHISGGDTLRKMLSQAGLDPIKTAIGDFGTFLRTHYGSDIVIKTAITNTSTKEIIFSGFRAPVEAQAIHDLGGKIIYIDAPTDARYLRVANRHKTHEVTDMGTLKQIDQQEHASNHPLAERLNDVRDMADVVIVNDQDLASLYKKLDDYAASLKD